MHSVNFKAETYTALVALADLRFLSVKILILCHFVQVFHTAVQWKKFKSKALKSKEFSLQTCTYTFRVFRSKHFRTDI